MGVLGKPCESLASISTRVTIIAALTHSSAAASVTRIPLWNTGVRPRRAISASICAGQPVHQHQANAQRREQVAIVGEPLHALALRHLAVEGDHEGLAAKGVDVRGGVAHPADESRSRTVLQRHGRRNLGNALFGQPAAPRLLPVPVHFPTPFHNDASRRSHKVCSTLTRA